MSRPPGADSERTYDEIVSAARAVLDDAPTKLSLRAVAKRAGVSLGTISYYFDTKDDLLEACLDGYYARLRAAAAQAMEIAQGEDDPRVVLERTARSFFRFAREERTMLRLRQSLNATQGELSPSRQAEFMGAAITAAVDTIAPHLEIDRLDARVGVQVMSTTILRFALMSDSELAAVTGLGADRAHDAIEEIIGRVGWRIFGAPET